MASTLKKRPSLFLRLVNRTLSDNRSRHSHMGYQRIPDSATVSSWAGAVFSRLAVLGHPTASGGERATSTLLHELCRYFGSDEVNEQLALSVTKKTEGSAAGFIHHPINPYMLPRRQFPGRLPPPQPSVFQRNNSRRLSSASGAHEFNQHGEDWALLKYNRADYPRIGAGELSLEGKRAIEISVTAMLILQISWCRRTSLPLFGQVHGRSPSARAPGRPARRGSGAVRGRRSAAPQNSMVACTPPGQG